MRSAAARSASAPTTPPVGFCGELRMTSFVRGPRRAPSSPDVEGEVRGLVERQGHGRGAGPADRRLVDREARVGVHDLVAGPAGGEDREEEERLGARAHQHALGVDRDAARARQLGGRGLAQLGQPGARAVVRLARAHRRAAGLDDVRRGREVRLADLEVDDVAPRALQRPRPRQHRERGLRPELSDPARQRRSRPHARRARLSPAARRRAGSGTPGSRRPARPARTARGCRPGAPWPTRRRPPRRGCGPSPHPGGPGRARA